MRNMIEFLPWQTDSTIVFISGANGFTQRRSCRLAVEMNIARNAAFTKGKETKVTSPTIDIFIALKHSTGKK
jgi:hypothetical protein